MPLAIDTVHLEHVGVRARERCREDLAAADGRGRLCHGHHHIQRVSMHRETGPESLRDAGFGVRSLTVTIYTVPLIMPARSNRTLTRLNKTQTEPAIADSTRLTESERHRWQLMESATAALQ